MKRGVFGWDRTVGIEPGSFLVDVVVHERLPLVVERHRNEDSIGLGCPRSNFRGHWGHLTERKKLYDFLFTPFLKLLRPVKIARYLALKQFLAVSETMVCETGL